MSKLIKVPDTTCYNALRNFGIIRTYFKMMGNPLIKRKIIVLKDQQKWVYIKERVWCVLYDDYDLINPQD